MAITRLALNNLKRRVSFSSSLLSGGTENGRLLSGNCMPNQRWMSSENMAMKRGYATAKDTSEGKEVSVSEGEKKSLFPRKRGRKSLWRNTDRNSSSRDLIGMIPSGLESAFWHASDNIYRFLDSLNRIPSRLMGRVKEQEDAYKLKYHMPGLAKEDVKITVDDGVLTIRGEHKEEQEDTSSSESDDEYWSARSYQYYNTSLLLPDDAKVDEIKAELKNGVLVITIPKTETPKKDVKEVQVQ